MANIITLMKQLQRSHMWLFIILMSSIETILCFTNGNQFSQRSNFGVHHNKHVVFSSQSSSILDHDNSIVANKQTNRLQEKIHDLFKNGEKRSQEKYHHSLVKEIQAPNELKKIITNEKDKVIVVRFFAHWCQVMAIAGFIFTYLLFTIIFFHKNRHAWQQPHIITS